MHAADCVTGISLIRACCLRPAFCYLLLWLVLILFFTGKCCVIAASRFHFLAKTCSDTRTQIASFRLCFARTCAARRWSGANSVCTWPPNVPNAPPCVPCDAAPMTCILTMYVRVHHSNSRKTGVVSENVHAREGLVQPQAWS